MRLLVFLAAAALAGCGRPDAFAQLEGRWTPVSVGDCGREAIEFTPEGVWRAGPDGEALLLEIVHVAAVEDGLIDLRARTVGENADGDTVRGRVGALRLEQPDADRLTPVAFAPDGLNYGPVTNPTLKTHFDLVRCT
jgi:hypothetical protein